VFLHLSLWPTAYVFVLALSFYYFILAGGRTFEVNPGDEMSSAVAQFSFLFTGTLATFVLALGRPLPLWNAVASIVLLIASLLLYEWARHVITHRRFHLAWTGDVPEEVCSDGPYRYVRHPLYASYILAFGAVSAAFPTLATLAILAGNVALFLHAAVMDERSLAQSELAPDYALYKGVTGMFLPHLRAVHRS
jgi:protein-S-isoprenylcysteine O-methyltransferase Ste14